MSLVVLTPLSQCAAQTQILAAVNPPMQYNVTLGTPTAQSITPPFPTQAAHIDEINGAGYSYTWNPTTGSWKQI